MLRSVSKQISNKLNNRWSAPCYTIFCAHLWQKTPLILEWYLTILSFWPWLIYHMLLATLTQGPTQAWRAATAWQLALATNIGQWGQVLPVRKYTSMIVWKYDSMIVWARWGRVNENCNIYIWITIIRWTNNKKTGWYRYMV